MESQLMREFQNKIPDIIFLDMLITCTDGLNCLQEIRNDFRYNEMPIIVYSSVNRASRIIAAFKQKANGYLYKAY
jgi:PleD family two-component response regulator